MRTKGRAPKFVNNKSTRVVTAGISSKRTRGLAPRLVVFERRYIPKGLAPRFDIGE